ncbi:hypothetical protein CEY00_Acc33437 [Actinidia chinensis var. chinensis]|uniref:Uncharacterized protein n=1 Tax=Actinidia chinensis var. chinensis TaxID=1590841 RepID=A0A2R6P580_ACTCC|nr:hypothetical protein CEY00_Acc33437 [Actinidia chinensis var. chinensis]
MHARHRSPGNGYRSSSMGVGGVAAASRISPEGSIRGRGMYNSEYRGYNRGIGRSQPKPFQVPPPPPRRTDIFMEAGRLAAEYLVSKGLLPPTVLSGRWKNGSLKNQVGDFQSFRQQEGDSAHLPPEGRDSALARLGNAADEGSGRRRFGDEYNPTGSRSYVRGRRRMGSFKNYGSDWGREMGRSGSWSDKARASPDRNGDNDSVSGYQEEQQLGNDVGNEGQMSRAIELAPKIDGAGDSEKFQFQDDTSTKASSSNTGKDLALETDVEITKRSDDMEFVNKEPVELKDGHSSDQAEKQSDMEGAPIQHFAVEDDSINKNGGDLLSFCRFAKVPTRTRSSLTTRGSKVDPVPTAEEEKRCDMGQEENNSVMGPPMRSEVPIEDVSADGTSVDASSNQNQSSKCIDSDTLEEIPVMSVEDAGELGPMYTDPGKYARSQSYADRSFINEQESSEGPPGFGRCSSMIMERGEKRPAQLTDSREGMKKPREWVPLVVTQTDEYYHLSHLKGKQPTSQEGRRSPGDEVILDTDQERSGVVSLFGRGDAGPCIEYAEEKQLFPGSFKICDLNLMEASESNENPVPVPVPDQILVFPSIPECKKEETPVDVDLSMSNNCNISSKYDRRGADGKAVEVIDLEDDSVQEDKAFNNSGRKEETVFTDLESFPNHAQSTNDISDVQDGYGLMISELLGADIPNCSSGPSDINSLHNDMALHNGEGILGDDESIYMSLGEIPISFLRVWEQPAQEYDKPF